MRVLVLSNDVSVNAALRDRFSAINKAISPQKNSAIIDFGRYDDISEAQDLIKGSDYDIVITDEALAGLNVGIQKIAHLVAASMVSSAPEKTLWTKSEPEAFRQQIESAVSVAFGYGADGIITAGDYQVDLMKRAAKVNGQSLDLTPSEFQILRLFCLEPHRFLSGEEAVQKLYGFNEYNSVPVNSFKSTISNLNKKICAVDDNYKIIAASKYSLLGSDDFFSIVEGLEYNPDSGILRSKTDDTERLGPNEAKILMTLKNAKGELLSRDALRAAVGLNSIGVLSTSLNKLRSKMASLTKGFNYIETVGRNGWRLSSTPVNWPMSKLNPGQRNPEIAISSASKSPQPHQPQHSL